MADETSRELTPAPGGPRRGGPVQFFQEVRRETSKVTWPTWRETYLTTIMVIIMVVVTMVFFAVVDYGLGVLLNFLLGIR
ncbi:MAG TPA: preprotein translocase subunit SecE [Micropepsaceae bacterium]|nr:preprotein translocase subunit SecE [Micropepsaceae bacterium]